MKKNIDVVRAWRDEDYRNSLSPEDRASLPQNPAGQATVEDSILTSITGGCGTPTTFVSSCVHYPYNCP
jgi:mersacidin/lichenicidin family type 2 lantibiotic